MYRHQNTVNKVKNSVDQLNSRLDTAEGRIRIPEGRPKKITQYVALRDKKGWKI